MPVKVQKNQRSKEGRTIVYQLTAEGRRKLRLTLLSMSPIMPVSCGTYTESSKSLTWSHEVRLVIKTGPISHMSQPSPGTETGSQREQCEGEIRDSFQTGGHVIRENVYHTATMAF